MESLGNSIKNFEGNAYLKKNGESDVMVSSSVWFSRLEPNASAYRDLRLFRSPVNAVDKLVFQMGKTEVSLINSEAQWIFPKQPLLKVDQNRVREIISMLNTTEAIEIVQEGKISQEDLKKWNLQNPQGKLTIYREQKNPWSIAFGRTDKIHRVFTSEPSWVLKVSPTDWDKFVNETSVNYFRDRGEPFSFDRSKVSKISVKVNGVVSSPEPDSEAYRTIVSRLATMKIADFEPKLPAGYSFSDEVVLQDTDGKELIRFSWGKPLLPQKDEQSRVIAKSSLYPKAFTILEGDLDTMKLEPVKENKE